MHNELQLQKYYWDIYLQTIATSCFSLIRTEMILGKEILSQN